MNELFSNYPKKFKASTQHAKNFYVIQKGIYAVHGEVPPPCKAAIMATIVEGEVAVCKGSPDKLPPSFDRNSITPVYALEPSGAYAVPSGLILVRFVDNMIAVSQKETFQRIGYMIDQEITYAPQALWVKSAIGDIAFALNNVTTLEAQPGVENVEPQMLMESVHRSSSSRPL